MDRSFTQTLLEILATEQDRAAIRTFDGQILSRGRLRMAILQVAQRLQQAGVGPGTGVFVDIANREVCFITQLAGVAVGAHVLMPPALQGFEALGHKIDVVVADSIPPTTAARIVNFDAKWLQGDAPELGSPETSGQFISASSGSTGTQKFMAASDLVAGGWLRLVRGAMAPDVGNRLITLPFFASFSWPYIAKSIADGFAVMGTAGDTEATLIAARDFAVREFLGTPQILAEIVAAKQNARPGPDLASVYFGGAVAEPALLQRTRATFPDVSVRVVAGMSEVGLMATGIVPAEGAPLGWCGTMVGPLEWRLLGQGGYAAFGQDAGRLALRMPADQRMTGYLGGDPIYDADGWYLTSDIARVTDEGEVIILGRDDFVINISGAKLTPEMIEMRCAEVAGVSAVAATKVDGASSEIVGLLIVATTGFDPEVLRAHLATRFGFDFTIRIRIVEALPLLGGGKVDRAAVAGAFI